MDSIAIFLSKSLSYRKIFFKLLKNLNTYCDLIQNCDALLIGAGAGMGVDSGLPDFRGKEGFWRAYPQMAQRGLCFEELANPIWFRKEPRLAWGFYGHRYQLYQKTHPHRGFFILKQWIEKFSKPNFVFTSNVDGHFDKAGWYHHIVECHGSLMYLQCLENCGQPIWEFQNSEAEILNISDETLECKDPLPACPNCHSIARPNILMFSDFYWHPGNYLKQKRRLQEWLKKHANSKLLIMEFGAGLDVPTVRSFCELIQCKYACDMVRINPRDFLAPSGVHAMPMGAKKALELLNQKLLAD